MKTAIILVVLLVTQAWGKSDERKLHKGVGGHIKTEKKVTGPYEDSAFWNTLCQEELKAQLLKQPIVQQAKNVIFFLGDGASVSTFTAGRIFKGQRTGEGEREILEWEKFPYSTLIKTYNTDKQVTDSAASATAYLTGVKTNQQNIGVDVRVSNQDCDAMNNEEFHTTSILRDFQMANKSTGFVTVTRVTHASPAGCYAHVADRSWENDADVLHDGADSDKCDDIAEQLVLSETGKNIKVIMGGGRENMLPRGYPDPEGEDDGDRSDDKNLIDTWLNSKEGNAQYVWHRDDLMAADMSKLDYILGLFGSSHMSYVYEQDESDPTLAEMTRAALELLQKDDNGYFLFVEGGHIDHAHHSNKYNSALLETLSFEDAVKVAVEMTSEEDTLIILTADHAHPLMINGYPDRGSDIGGLGDVSDMDGKPFTTLMYGNGPGYKDPDANGLRPDPSLEDFKNPLYRGAAVAPDGSANHSGDDVILFARGPFAHLFTGNHENSYIPHALRYASCTGPGMHFCDS